MSIEVTTIPREPQWEDIVIDANKDFNSHWISNVKINAKNNAGNAPLSINSTARSTTSTTFVKRKETRIWRAGTYRITFDLVSGQAGTAVFGIIRRNGVNVGTGRVTTSRSWVTFTEDISDWNIGDFVQVYIRTSDSTVGAMVQNLKLFIHESDFTEEIL